MRDDSVSDSELEDALAYFEAKQQGAVYVLGLFPAVLIVCQCTQSIHLPCINTYRNDRYACFPDTLFRPSYATILHTRQYRFWNYNSETSEFIYCKWTDPTHTDAIPPYATSIEGGGLLVLSPDETKLLMVHERGRWSFPGGAVDYNETSFEVGRVF